MHRWLIGSAAALLTLFSASLTGQVPNWTEQNPTTPLPSPRVMTALAYDAAHSQVVLYGGLDNNPSTYPTADTWVWDGSNWTQKFPATNPGIRSGHSMAYDAAHGQVVLFGGQTNNETWVWDGTAWTKKFPATSPLARFYACMAYDEAHGQVVLFGGLVGDSLVHPGISDPSDFGRMHDTWVWDGSNWTRVFPANSPPARVDHSMAYDKARGQTALFGGNAASGYLNDTWVWDGSNWTQKSPVTNPPTRDRTAMVYDSLRAQVLMFGGEAGISPLPLNDTWLWDGSNWTQLTTSVTPPARFWHVSAFDEAHGQAVLFGGVDLTNIFNDTWVWPGDLASPKGTITVTTNLSAASFTINGPASYSGGGTSFTQTNAPVGTYTITYGPVAGCSSPPPQTSALTSGGTLTFTGNYQSCVGTINIQSNITNATFILSPPVPGSPKGGPFPVTLSNVPIGTYQVVFNPVPGYITPALTPISVTPNTTTTFAGNYMVNGATGLGRITITTNLDAASFGIISTSSTTFVSFTRGGKFFDTLVTIPAGTYQISFTPVPGYFTPPNQTLTLNPSGAIQFTGVYKRVIVVLFTGFNNRPITTSDGVTYPDTCDLNDCPGMANLAQELRSDATLKAGIIARTFTFYDRDQYLSHPPVTSTPGCGPPSFTDPVPQNPECLAPITDAYHQIAQNWINSVAPTPDDRVLVIGHSYGGNRARLFAQQLANKGFSVDAIATVDPIDWNSCHLLNGAGFLSIDPGCDFSNGAEPKPDGVHYVLAYTQTQSVLLKGYHLAIPGFAYPYTIFNDPSCLPTDLFCSHVSISTDLEVHSGAIQLAKSILQSSGQVISGIQTSGVTTSTATVSWNTQDDTAAGKVTFSQQANFSTSLTVQEVNPLGPVKSHAITLSGLLSNTTYYFKIQVAPPGIPIPITSAVESLRTMPSVPSIRATSGSLTVGTAAARLQFILTDSGAPVTGVSITSAKIGTFSTTTQLPLPISDLGPVQSPLITLIFPKSIGAVGSTVVPIITLKYSAGTITVGVPPTKIQ